MLVAINLFPFSAQAQTETLLYSFGSPSSGDASGPLAGLIMDKKGNLYGTTNSGGANGWGAVFKLIPAGTETVIYSFKGDQLGDGANPLAGLVMDKQGNLYGTTGWGGTQNEGTVFKLTSAGTETVLHSFDSQSGDGWRPEAGLVIDGQGILYGTTTLGGAYGGGTVFKVTPEGTETLLYSFGSQSGDGWEPWAGLIMDKQGNLYGTTPGGGAKNRGTVFKVTPEGTETVLYSFGSHPRDGKQPFAGLIMDHAGNFYGTTEMGGGPKHRGTVFKLAPDGTETVLYGFGSQSGDGRYPLVALVMDKQGNLYGTTFEGGAYRGGTLGAGTVFQVTPQGTETVLYSFGGRSGDGWEPEAGLLMDKKGNLYGTTFEGGANNWGTVFKITLE
jgi:uncharacterized repeat protein (TIGR03803 family)